MTVKELMNGKTPSATYEGFSTADDFVLAVNFENANNPTGYVVAQQGISEHTGSLNPVTSDAQYIRTGQVTTKTGTQRQFAVSGDRYFGDAFQDACLDHELKYGTGQAVVKEYVYFNMLTGKGETGSVSIAVEDDLAGAAGENASFSATLSALGTPAEYTYTPVQG